MKLSSMLIGDLGMVPFRFRSPMVFIDDPSTGSVSRFGRQWPLLTTLAPIPFPVSVANGPY